MRACADTWSKCLRGYQGPDNLRFVRVHTGPENKPASTTGKTGGVSDRSTKFIIITYLCKKVLHVI